MKDGKVILTIYGVDDDTDIKTIISPNGEEKKINYEEDRIINITDLLTEVDPYVQTTVKNFHYYLKEIVYHVQDKKSEEIDLQKDKKNIIVNTTWYWGIKKPKVINQCFENGFSVLTNGNDNKSDLKIIKSYEQGSAEEIQNTKILKSNEITSQDINSSEQGEDGKSITTIK